MTADQLIAIAAIGLTALLAILGAMWKLATMLAEVKTVTNRELSHNGGSSLKDFARDGRDEAIAARNQAMQAKHLAENVDAKVDQLAKAQTAIERKLAKVTDVVVGMQAVQTFRDSVAAGPPGSTTSSQSTTTTHTTTEGAP